MSSAECELPLPMATPMLAVTKSDFSPASKGWRRLSLMRSATTEIDVGCSTCSQSTTNSSPAKRATVSPGRTCSIRRLATVFNSTSPASWPQVSLMSLKPSRSTNSKATESPCRRERCNAVTRRSRISARLGRPVSGSCVARRVRSSSARLRSVMSRMITTSSHSPSHIDLAMDASIGKKLPSLR